MTAEAKKQLQEIAPWVNRVLLGIVAYFLIQTNSKFNEVIVKLDTVIITQAQYAEKLQILRADMAELKMKQASDNLSRKSDIKEMQANVTKFYKENGYLFTDKAKEVLK